MWAWAFLVQGAHGKGWKGWGGGFTVTNVRMKKQDWEAQQPTRGHRKLWASGPCPLSASPAVWAGGSSRREQSCATSPRCQDHVLNPRGGCKPRTVFVVGLLLESVVQGSFSGMLVSYLIQEEPETGAPRCPSPSSGSWPWLLFKSTAGVSMDLWHFFPRWLRRPGADKWFFHFSWLILD